MKILGIHIHIYLHRRPAHDPLMMEMFSEIKFLLQNLNRKEEKIIMKLDEVKGVIDGIRTQVEKAKAEIVQKIADLEAALPVDLPQDAVDALDALKASVQSVDDIVPDAPPVEPPIE